jgi:hypothetical protein
VTAAVDGVQALLPFDFTSLKALPVLHGLPASLIAGSWLLQALMGTLPRRVPAPSTCPKLPALPDVIYEGGPDRFTKWAGCRNTSE